MNTVIIYTGPHYPSDRHEINKCDNMLTDGLRRMAYKHHWPINIKEGGEE